ncbi:MAG: YlmC/YmxH family sporulation protein [Oscillospiraceae bacterium]|jgi:YlmC/YmxH family sporulation protein|nr:YlmC/YmxH family sporulation protein [Oscillospiraceae bacterium]
MLCSIQELCEKDVINTKTGCRLGPVCDVEVDTETGKLISLIIFGRQKLISLGPREEDIKIKWEDITVIGNDTILVSADHIQDPSRPTERKTVWNSLFR